MKQEEVRGLFPVLAERAYLFSGGLAPVSIPTRAAVERFVDEVTYDPNSRYDRLDEEYRRAQNLFASLIGAAPDEVLITDSTGAGSSLAVEILDGFPGDNVVFDHLTYPSSVYPWMLPGRDSIERRFVAPRDGAVHIDDLAEAVDDRTIAVSVSHVCHMTGFRHDLEALGALCADHGAALVVDAMQSAGAVRIDVRRWGVHFLACGAMKWLLGSAGVGFLYIDRRYLDRLPPRAGISGVRYEADAPPWTMPPPKPGADRFRLGAPPLLGLAATTPGLEILTGAGMAEVERRVLDLAGYCIAGLVSRGLDRYTSADPARRAGIVAVRMDRPGEVCDLMRRRGVDVWHYGNMLRVDPHVFNNRGDIDRFLAVIDEAGNGGRRRSRPRKPTGHRRTR